MSNTHRRLPVAACTRPQSQLHPHTHHPSHHSLASQIPRMHRTRKDIEIDIKRDRDVHIPRAGDCGTAEAAAHPLASASEAERAYAHPPIYVCACAVISHVILLFMCGDQPSIHSPTHPQLVSRNPIHSTHTHFPAFH